MAKKRKKRLTERQFTNAVVRLINRYGRVRITSETERDESEVPCDCLCKTCKAAFEDEHFSNDPLDQRRRLITKDGMCQVSYKSEGYSRWSGYEVSCFLDNYTDEDGDYCEMCWSYNCSHVEPESPKKTPRKTIGFLLDHDRGDMKPVIVEYGPRFKRKMKL